MVCLHKMCPAVALLILTFFSSSSPLFAADGESLQIKGSDTMVNLGQAWAEEFMHTHPKVSIAVTGGGSGTGIAAIIAGTCDIAQSSREIKPEESAKASAGGPDIVQTVVAYDGIAVIIHPANTVSELTLGQIADIFTGKIQNWNEVGGKDLPLLVLSRERNSGTHVFFLEHVLRKGNARGLEEFAESVLMMPSSQAIVQEVESSEAAIGYVGLGYVTEKQKVVAVGQKPEGPYVLLSIETVQSGEYSISRPLYFLTRGQLRGEMKEFVDFVLSPEGQEIVRVLEFVPLKTNGGQAPE